MQVSTAIWMINPQAEYRLTNANATSWEDIIEWRGPGPKPTPQELQDAWDTYVANQATEEAENLYAQEIQDGAETEISTIPGYASWDKTTADAYYQTNVRDPFAAATTAIELKAVLGTMIVVQWALIRMVIAMRNKLWWWMQNQT